MAVVAKHADDVHMGATPEETNRTRKAVEDAFGPVTWKERNFVGVGVSHKQREDGTVELDQDAYIAQPMPIAGPSLFGKPADEEADADLQWAFMRLLGAVAYALITQHWVSVYVVALQR